MIYNGVEYYYIKNILKPGKKTVPGEIYGKDLEQKMKDYAGKTKLIVTANGYRKEIDCDLPVNNYLSLLPE